MTTKTAVKSCVNRYWVEQCGQPVKWAFVTEQAGRVTRHYYCAEHGDSHAREIGTGFTGFDRWGSQFTEKMERV